MPKVESKTVYAIEGSDSDNTYDTPEEALSAAYSGAFYDFFEDLDLDASKLIRHEGRLPANSAAWLQLVNDLRKTNLLNRANHLLFGEDGGGLRDERWGTLFAAMNFIHTHRDGFAKLIEQYKVDAARLPNIKSPEDGPPEGAAPGGPTRALDMGEDNDGRNEDDGESEAHGHPD